LFLLVICTQHLANAFLGAAFLSIEWFNLKILYDLKKSTEKTCLWP